MSNPNPKTKYVSVWQKRKRARMQNRNDLENGLDTPATRMMKQNNITGRPYGWRKKSQP